MPVEALRSEGPLVLGLDLGTGSAKACLVDANGKVLAVARRRLRHPAEPGVPASQRFDTEASWQAICEVVREVLGELPDATSVAALGYGCFGGGLVAFDAKGTALWSCTNGDARSSDEGKALLASGEAERLYRLGGSWISLSAPPRLRWLRRHEPDLFRVIKRIGAVGDWLTYRLSGHFLSDPSIASSSGLLELAARRWATEAAEIAGISPTALPELMDAGTDIGALHAEAAEQLGLSPKTHVALGGWDTALALLGSGDSRAGVTITAGSFWKQSIRVPEATIEPRGRLRSMCDVVPQSWIVEGLAFYAGSALDWCCEALLAAERRNTTVSALDMQALDELAGGLGAGSGGLEADLPLADAWSWVTPADVRLRIDRQQPAASVRAIEEAASYVTRFYVDALVELLGAPFHQALMTGGAARARTWPRILANVLDLPIQVVTAGDATLRGAAALAARSAGLMSRADQWQAAVSSSIQITPDPVEAAAYQQLYRSWQGRRLLPLSGGG